MIYIKEDIDTRSFNERWAAYLKSLLPGAEVLNHYRKLPEGNNIVFWFRKSDALISHDMGFGVPPELENARVIYIGYLQTPEGRRCGMSQDGTQFYYELGYNTPPDEAILSILNNVGEVLSELKMEVANSEMSREIELI